MTQLTPDPGQERSDTPEPGNGAPQLQRHFDEELQRREAILAKIKETVSPTKGFIWAGIGLVFFGVAFVVAGLREGALASASSAVPEEISLKDLIARGPDGNPNVILTNFVLCDRVVYQKKKREESWEKAWLPVVPRESVPPGADRARQPGTIRAVLMSQHASGEADFYRRCQQPKLRALVTNRTQSLDGKELELLREFYATDFSGCLILEEGEAPPGFLKIALMVGGGIAGAAWGLWLLRQVIYHCIRNQPPKEFRG